MNNIRKEERKLYARCQLLKNLRNNQKVKKEITIKIEEKRKEIKEKQLFFHNYLIAYDKVRKGEN